MSPLRNQRYQNRARIVPSFQSPVFVCGLGRKRLVFRPLAATHAIPFAEQRPGECVIIRSLTPAFTAKTGPACWCWACGISRPVRRVHDRMRNQELAEFAFVCVQPSCRLRGSPYFPQTLHTGRETQTWESRLNLRLQAPINFSV